MNFEYNLSYFSISFLAYYSILVLNLLVSASWNSPRYVPAYRTASIFWVAASRRFSALTTKGSLEYHSQTKTKQNNHMYYIEDAGLTW